MTNQLQYLGEADKVVYIDAGRIEASGTLEEVTKCESFALLLNEFNAKAGEEAEGSADFSSDEDEVRCLALGFSAVAGSGWLFQSVLSEVCC